MCGFQISRQLQISKTISRLFLDFLDFPVPKSRPWTAPLKNPHDADSRLPRGASDPQQKGPAWSSGCGKVGFDLQHVGIFSKYEDFMKCPYERILLNHEIWVVPDIGLPPNQLHFNGIIFNKNHPAIGGTPMTMETLVSSKFPIYVPYISHEDSLSLPLEHLLVTDALHIHGEAPRQVCVWRNSENITELWTCDIYIYTYVIWEIYGKYMAIYRNILEIYGNIWRCISIYGKFGWDGGFHKWWYSNSWML